MPLIVDKLAKLDGQTLNNVNWYSYIPENGDTSTDVLVTGYFENSQYIDTEHGWANSPIFAVLDDGEFIFKVDDTEITVTQVGAGGSEIPALEGEIALSRVQSNGVTVLGAGNTNLTDAMGGKLLVANAGGAQSLTVDVGLLVSNLKLNIACQGAGGLTVTAGLGVTITGDLTLVSGESRTLFRDALTETYYCI